MLFPKDFHGQTTWVGRPLRRGVTIRFSAESLRGGTHYRIIRATLCVNGAKISLSDYATTVHVGELGGLEARDPWAFANLERQTMKVMSQVMRFRLSLEQTTGFRLHGYLITREPADLIWRYMPEPDQPQVASLLGETPSIDPTPLATIEEYMINMKVQTA